MEILNFFARDYRGDSFPFDIAFNLNNNTIWFVENRQTQEWIAEDGTLTKDPLKAKQYSSEISAMIYIIKNKIWETYIATEHEFTPPQGGK